MKTKQLFFNTVIAAAICGPAMAQCSFTPTISPTNLILCPNETDTLWTQGYDAHQWFFQGNPIPGATDSFLVVDAFNYAGGYVGVEATLGGCTELSDTVLVDGWAFLPIYAISDPGPAYVSPMVEFFWCYADTVTLTAGGVGANIQWTNNNVPIPGATDDTLLVTTAGNYSVSGAPSVCPDFIMTLGVTVSISYLAPFVPPISYSFGTLFADSGETGFQWYLDGVMIPGANDSLYVPLVSGFYSVYAENEYGCGGFSDSMEVTLPTGIDPVDDQALTVYPNPATVSVFIGGTTGATMVKIYDMAGKVLNVSLVQPGMPVDVSSLVAGIYVLETGEGNAMQRHKLVIR